MSRLSCILDELLQRIPRRLSARALYGKLLTRRPATIRNLRRDLEELESRDVPTLLGQQLFPLDNPMNQNIANAPVAANSTAIINHIGTTVKVHPDLGYDSPANTGDPIYGIPYNVVHGNSVTKVNVIIDGYPSQSDELPVPIPANAVIEGDYQSGPNLNGPGYSTGERGDSHLIIWDEDNNIAYELFGTSRPTDVTNSSGEWEALQETVWNMNTDTFRSLGETSADAAGLSILAGLLRPDEALPTSQGGQGAIDHALRFTLPSADIAPQYTYPASHAITVSPPASDLLPMGGRLRLKDTTAVNNIIATMGPEAQVVARAMQQYGLILADDGSSMFITGSSASVDANNDISLTWDISDILTLEDLSAKNFQVVNLTPTVTGLSESTGTGGDTITITGQNFSGAAGNLSVFFGTTAATSVTYVSDTEITAVVPNGTGTVDVTVQSGVVETGSNSSENVTAPIFGYGTSATSSSDQFTYQNVSGNLSSVSFASGSDISGQGDLVTISLENTIGNVVSGLPSSAFNFTLGNGTSTGTFGPVSETATPGTYTTTFTGYTAGTPSTLTLTVDTVQISAHPTVQVTAGTVSGSASSVSFASSTDISGQPDGVTIELEDAAGNPISGLSSSDFAFTLAGGTSTGTFGTVSPGMTAGSYTDTFTGLVAGSATSLVLKVNNVAIAAAPSVTVQAGALSPTNSSASFASATDAAGTYDVTTILLKDANGNPISGLPSGDFMLTLGGGTSTGSFGSVTSTTTPGTYTANFDGALVGTPEALTVAVNEVAIASHPTVQVIPGGVSGQVSTFSFASPSVASGSADSVTILVRDAAGNVITGLPSNAFLFSQSGDTSTGIFSAVTETSTLGTYTATYTGVHAGSPTTVILEISGIFLSIQPPMTVTPGPLSGANSTVSFATPTNASGTTDTATIVLMDAAGNAITGLPNGDFTFALLSGSSTGTFGTVTETSTPGTYTVPFTGLIAGSVSTYSFEVNAVELASQPTVTVTPGAVSGSGSSLSFALPTNVSGTTDLLTITVKDAAGNVIPGLASSAFTFSLAGGASTGTFGSVTPTSTSGIYSTTFTGALDGTPSTLTTTINSVALTTKPTITVTAGAINGSRSTASFATASAAAGTPDTVSIVVEDAAGNAISGLTNADFTLSLAGGTSTGTFGNVTPTSTPGTYSATFTGALAGTAATLTVKVDAVTLTAQPQVTVNAGEVSGANSTVSLAAATDSSGLTDVATIVVKDAYGNLITGLAGGAFSFNLAGGTSTGTFNTVTSTATAGTYTSTFTGVLDGSPSTLTTTVNSVVLASQPTIQVTQGGVSASKSTLSFATANDPEGTVDTLTIHLEDAAGNAINGMPANVFEFSLSGGASTGTFGTVVETATPGTYTDSFTGTSTGSISTLTTVVSTIELTAQPQVTVIPSGVSGTNSTVSFAAPTDSSGLTDVATIVVKDAYGNPITGLASAAFSFSLAGGTSTGTFSAVTPTATPGTYSSTFTGALDGSPSTLTTSVNSVVLASQPTIQVTQGGVSGITSTVSFASANDPENAADVVTIHLEDAAGNAINGMPANAFVFSLSGGTSAGTFGTVVAAASPGTYTDTFTGTASGSISTLTTKVSTITLESQPQVTVLPETVSGTKSTVSLATTTDSSGSPDTVTIVVKNGAGAAVTGLPSSAFAFTLAGGTSTGTFGAATETSTAGTYTASFTGVVAGTTSTFSVAVSNVTLSTQPTVQVKAGAVSGSRSSVTFASPTVASGTTDGVTIAVADAAGNAIAGLPSSAFAFTLTGGTSTGIFSSVTPAATPGTYAATFTAETQGTASNLLLKINGVALATQPPVTVTPPLVSGSKSTVSFAAATVNSGLTDSVTIVVKNTGGVAVTGLTTSDFTFSLAGGTSTGSFGTVSPTATPGTYETTFTGLSAGTSSALALAVDGIPLTSAPKVTVKSGVRSGQTSTASFATATVNSGATETLTIVVRDAAGNPINGFPNASFVLSLGGGTSTGTLGAVTETALPGTYSVTFTGVKAGSADTLTVAVNGVALSEHPTVQVTPGIVGGAKSTLSVASSTVNSGTTDVVTIHLKDHNLNPISGLPGSDFTLNLGRGQSTGTFGPVTETATPGTYTALLTGVTAGTASTLSVSVEGVVLSSEPKITVKPGAVSSTLSSASLASPVITSGQTDQVTLVVVDAAGNPVTGLPNVAFLLMLSGGTSTATFGTVTPTKQAGFYTVLMTGGATGTASNLVVDVAGVQLATQPSILVM